MALAGAGAWANVLTVANTMTNNRTSPKEYAKNLFTSVFVATLERTSSLDVPLIDLVSCAFIVFRFIFFHTRIYPIRSLFVFKHGFQSYNCKVFAKSVHFQKRL